MLNRSMSLLSLALVLVVAPSALRAQISAPLAGSSRPVYDRFTVGGAFGGLSGAGNLNQAGTADWRLGWAGSLNTTGWVNDYAGVPAGAGWGEDRLRGPAVTGRWKLNKLPY